MGKGFEFQCLFYFNAPAISCFIHNGQSLLGQRVPLPQDLTESVYPQHVPESSLSQQPGTTGCIGDVVDWGHWIPDSEVENCVHCYGDTVFR